MALIFLALIASSSTGCAPAAADAPADASDTVPLHAAADAAPDEPGTAPCVGKRRASGLFRPTPGVSNPSGDTH